MGFFKDFSLKKVTLSHYKNLIDCNLEINDFSILVGANNSGKSNFIELFTILNNIFYGGEKGREYAAKKMLFCDEPTTVTFEYEATEKEEIIKAEYKIIFISQKEEKEYNIKILFESLYFKSISSTGNPKKLFLRDNKKLTLRVKNGIFKKRIINDQIPVFDVLKSLYPQPDDLPDEYNIILPLLFFVSPAIISAHKMSSNYNEEIEELFGNLYSLQKQNDESFITFKKYFLDILELDDIIFKEHFLEGEKKQEPIYFCTIKERNKNNLKLIEYMSDGTKILFLLLYHIFLDELSLLCIEEPEIGLHPKALSKLLQLFFNKEVSAQAIITTHSPYLIKLVNPQNVFVLEAKENSMYSFTKVSTIKDLKKRLKSKYVDFGDLFVENFKTDIDTRLD
ncbi:MAG: AAA family ATPase [Candidatus Latescibacteria bacterium]|nr:AAA family ATPase [Candidatus Latescibacterota bacterium]